MTHCLTGAHRGVKKRRKVHFFEQEGGKGMCKINKNRA